MSTSEKRKEPDRAAVRRSGQLRTMRDENRVPIEEQRAQKKPAMYAGIGRGGAERGRLNPFQVEVYTGGPNGEKELMMADDTRDAERLELTHAPNPPPGYRYTLKGKLVPLVETRIPLSCEQGKAIFLEMLEVTGSARAGLDALGIYGMDTLQNQLAKDKEFSDAYDVALDRHRSAIYAAAHQRAVHGYEVPIVGGQFKDQIVAYERKYSDNIMMLMLKRHFPEFRDAAVGTKVVVNQNNDNRKVELTGFDPAKLNKDQRAKMRAFLESMEETPQIPERVIDAESTEVKKP